MTKESNLELKERVATRTTEPASPNQAFREQAILLDALRQSEAYLAEAQRLSHTGSWAFGLASNKYIYVSEECARIFELDAQEDLRNRESVSRLIHPGDWDRVKADFEKSVRERVDTSSEFRITVPTGTAKHIQVIRHPVLNDAGEVVKLVGTVIDITERKRAEEALQASEAERRRTEMALREARAELDRVSRVMTMGELAASIAHEVSQPLAGVVTSASACRNSLTSEPPNIGRAREAIEQILQDGTRAGEVLGRIRGLLKRAPPTRAPVSLNDIARDVAALVSGELDRQKVRVSLELDCRLPRIVGDSIQLQQVLLNLLLNASEAMTGIESREKTLTIRTKEAELNGQPAVTLEVSDVGIGFSKTDAAHLFEAFHTTKPQGMGMGLWISRSIVEDHGGRLAASCNAGPGATFVTILPAKKLEQV
jgi:PAS domain S-box-containing protein